MQRPKLNGSIAVVLSYEQAVLRRLSQLWHAVAWTYLPLDSPCKHLDDVGVQMLCKVWKPCLQSVEVIQRESHGLSVICGHFEVLRIVETKPGKLRSLCYSSVQTLSCRQWSRNAVCAR
jgi:hypothetical protein